LHSTNDLWKLLLILNTNQ